MHGIRADITTSIGGSTDWWTDSLSEVRERVGELDERFQSIEDHSERDRAGFPVDACPGKDPHADNAEYGGQRDVVDRDPSLVRQGCRTDPETSRGERSSSGIRKMLYCDANVDEEATSDRVQSDQRVDTQCSVQDVIQQDGCRDDAIVCQGIFDRYSRLLSTRKDGGASTSVFTDCNSGSLHGATVRGVWDGAITASIHEDDKRIRTATSLMGNLNISVA